MAKTELECANCGSVFLKENKELNRRLRAGVEEFYCSLSCGAYASNSRPEKQESNRESARRMCAKVNKNPHLVAKAHRHSQGWKYEELHALLVEKGVVHKFEYPLIDANGTIRLYDLALRDCRTLVEFDGPHHRTDSEYRNSVDALKDELAVSNGWKIVRIDVEPNAIIQRKLIGPKLRALVEA